MSSSNYIKTIGFVLRRTNYAEADRILNIMTPLGKISAIAKGVRREKSKLAGGVEMFSLIDFNIHKGRGDIGTITSARMMEFYGEILKSIEKMELAGSFLMKINKVAEGSDAMGYFDILKQSLMFLNCENKLAIVEAWFLLNLNRVSGEEINLYRDEDGNKLDGEKRYRWNMLDAVFSLDDSGEYGVNEIKMLRLMLTNKLALVNKVRIDDGTLIKVLNLSRATNKI